MAVKMYIFKDASGEHRWRLVDTGNHRIIAVSGEGYVTRGGCVNAAANVIEDIMKATFHDVMPEEIQNKNRV